MDLSRYAAATLHQDSEFVWCRGRAPESPTPHRPSVRRIDPQIRASWTPPATTAVFGCHTLWPPGPGVCLLVVMNSLDLHSASTGALTGTVTDPPDGRAERTDHVAQQRTAETRASIRKGHTPSPCYNQ